MFLWPRPRLISMRMLPSAAVGAAGSVAVEDGAVHQGTIEPASSGRIP